MITIPSSPNVGEILKTYIKTNRKYKSGIANWLGIGKSAVEAYLKNADMKVSTLWRLSHVLKHNFFAEVGAQLPPEFTATTENPLQARLTELEKQKGDLELQVKTLEKALELVGRK